MELLERFAHGDLDAFEILFRQYQREVYCWIVPVVRDPVAAEDVTVETFWRIYRTHARFDPAQGFGKWARRIATNAALSYLKTNPRQPDPPAGWQQAAVADSEPDPVEQRDLGDAIRVAFHGIPPRLRVVATLVLIEEQPHDEVAEALGISLAAVKSREFRAVRLLRKRLNRLGVRLWTTTKTEKSGDSCEELYRQ